MVTTTTTTVVTPADSPIVAYLQGFFDDKLMIDNREPWIEFVVPGTTDKYGLFAPGVELWKQIVLVVLLQLGYQYLMAAIIYKYILCQRRNDQNQSTPLSSYLLGWGVIFPLSLYVPFFLVEIFDLRNHVLKLGAAAGMGVVSFRVVEAMYGTCPPVVESVSMGQYIHYYTCTVPYVWNAKTQSPTPITLKKLMRNMGLFALNFTAFSVMLSFLMHFDFKPFSSDLVQLEHYHFNGDLFRPSHLANAYLQAVMTYVALRVTFDSTALGENARGYDTVPIFINPLFASRTPTEFWTKRWNTMIYTGLKHAVFRPAIQFVPSKVAVLLTFVMSGVFHDFIWSVVFYRPNRPVVCDDGDCLVPQFGKLTAFFLYTGIIMLLERPLCNTPPFIWMSKNLPTPLISTLLVVLHLPFAHWYMGDWIVGGWFSDFAIGLWHIRKL